ncbi:MAG: GNAT family N-acetyltransferase [Gloeocapsa sp. DLM2.Bin57]|nr:MAG: GNAT family N-acetyltransferase [Gloeocapsa sp. DLM2.Bin57]
MSNKIRLAIIIFNSPQYQESLQLREEILRKPLGLSLTTEDLANEEQQTHLGVFIEDKLIGIVILKPTLDARIVKLRQMAIAPSYQNQGIGTQLMQYAEPQALSQGYQQIELHARYQYQRFYTKLGYQPVGEPFIEVTIPHILMTKKIVSYE